MGCLKESGLLDLVGSSIISVVQSWTLPWDGRIVVSMAREGAGIVADVDDVAKVFATSFDAADRWEPIMWFGFVSTGETDGKESKCLSLFSRSFTMVPCRQEVAPS